MEDASKDKKQSKVRGSSYKLRSYIELATNLKKVFEERILNSKVEMTLGDILGIAKREFHEKIIDIIKRKQHVPVEQETNPTNIQNILHEELEYLEEPRARMENDVVLEVKHAHFHEHEESDEVPRSHFLRSHWTRATTETVVKTGDFEEPILALVDHGLEINLMSKTLYQKGKWPIDLDHGWRIRAANTQLGFLYGACANVKVTIGDITIIKRGYDGAEEGEFSQGAFSSSFVGLTSEGSYSYRKFGELHKWEKKYVSHFQSEMQGCVVLDPNDMIFGIFEEVSHIDIIADLEAIDVSSSNNDFIKVNSSDMYEVLSQFCEKCEDALEVQVETKYKTTTKKVQMVRRCQSSPEIWAFLRSTYHHKDLITHVRALKKLLLAVLTEHQDTSKFLDDWCTLLDNALLSGLLLDDSLQAMLLLAALPTSWRPFITTQASVVGLTVETLIARILQEDAMHGNSTPTTIPSSQYVQRQSNFRRWPFCRFNNTRNPVNNPTPAKICIHYGRHGHLVHECRTKRREQQRTDRRPRSQPQHIEVPALSQYDMESLRLFTSMLNSTRYLATSTDTSAEWLLDTGATHHMTSTSSWLRDYKTLARDVQVYLGNNHCLHAIGLGNLHVTLPSGAAIIIRDIYHIPDLHRNILSVTAATSSGSSIEFTSSYLTASLKSSNSLNRIGYTLLSLHNQNIMLL
ncbi:hypothetical protein L7F22_006028 [Adiantum nelumboides]|nr:hypothetical protein [Adiantum nelumboides]